MLGSRKGPTFSRIDQTKPYDSGRGSFRSILMQAMREDASRVIIQPREGHPSLIHAVMKFLREKPISTVSPGLDELIAHLVALPHHQFKLNLDDLTDEKLSEFQPCNDLAHDQIAWYRSAPRKEYEVFVQVNEQERKAEITLKPAK